MFYKIYYIYLEWYYKFIYRLDKFINPEDFYSDSDSDSDSHSQSFIYYNNEFYV